VWFLSFLRVAFLSKKQAAVPVKDPMANHQLSSAVKKLLPFQKGKEKLTRKTLKN
jgi:hypothetical protein